VRPIPIDLETVTEARLVSEALGGSQSAFEQIVRRYQRPVIGLIARMVGDRAAAEDLAQESFVKAFRSLNSFDVTRRLSSWLFRIAHNTALDWLRRTRPTLVSLDDVADEGARRAAEIAAPAAVDPVERKAMGQAIEAAMQALRPAYRAAVALRYEEGLSFEEIGHVLGVPEATARTYVHRARKELAQALTAVGWAP
jgi:RNA polymerase sigma-70 factor (ECF subfamily)